MDFVVLPRRYANGLLIWRIGLGGICGNSFRKNNCGAVELEANLLASSHGFAFQRATRARVPEKPRARQAAAQQNPDCRTRTHI